MAPRVAGERATAGTIAERVAEVRERIAAAAQRAGRAPEEITLVGVSKFVDAERVREAVRAGVTHLGENRAQELTAKSSALAGETVTWHFVGRLQRNKAPDVVGVAGLIHSVDRAPLVDALADAAVRRQVVQEVLVQVNVADDPSKAGVTPSDAAGLVARIDGSDVLRCTGLMTIPPLGVEPREIYQTLRALRDDLRERHPQVRHLSMGMTNDFEVAVAEGATIVRVGQALFGPRPDPTLA